MKIPGWAYLIVGILVAALSGYVYKFVPKNGQPNMAMAVFFFIGIVFISIGVIKIFFRRIESVQASNFDREIKEATRVQPNNTQNISHMHRAEHNVNKIYQENASKQTHTNAYSQTHQYQSPHMTHHNQPPAHQTMHQQMQPTHHMSQSYAIIQCRKCGNKNYSHSNYCHVCGSRLR